MFKKLLTYFLCDNIGQKTFSSIIKPVFRGKRELYLFYCNSN